MLPLGGVGDEIVIAGRDGHFARAKESQFETVVGTAVKNLFADAASGKPVSAATVKAQLSSAQQQMNG